MGDFCRLGESRSRKLGEPDAIRSYLTLLGRSGRIGDGAVSRNVVVNRAPERASQRHDQVGMSSS